MIQALREFFLLDNALRTVDTVPEARRSEVADALRLARQQGEAGEALWTAGHTAEGLKLSLDALGEGVRAVEAFDAETAKEPAAEEPSEKDAEASADERSFDQEKLRRVLLARGVPEPRLKALIGVLRDVETKPRARFDAEISRAHEDLFQEVIGGRELIDQALRLASQTKSEIRRLRASRFAAVGAVALVVAAALAWKYRPSDGVHAFASATWGDAADHQPDTVIDGVTSTFWLLPDRSPGWIELRFDRSRHVNQVRIHNTHNEPWNDRGARGYRIELYSGNDLVRGIDAEFGWDTNDWVTHEAAADDVDRVRIVVNSFYHSGAGISEIEVQ